LTAFTWRSFGSSVHGASAWFPESSSSVDGLAEKAERWIRRQPAAVLQIMTINSGVFLMWRIPSMQSFMFKHFTTSFATLASGRLHTLATSAFSHQGYLHFAFNMIALSSFAPPLIYVMGHQMFLGFYVGSGIVASLSGVALQFLQFLVRRESQVLARQGLGASGAIFAMAAVFANTFPSAKFHIIFLPQVQFKAESMLPAMAVFDCLGCLYGFFRDSPLGHGTHLGGLVCGHLFYHKYLVKHNSKLWKIRQIYR